MAAPKNTQNIFAKKKLFSTQITHYSKGQLASWRLLSITQGFIYRVRGGGAGSIAIRVQFSLMRIRLSCI